MNAKTHNEEWYVDLGATNHMTQIRAWMENYSEYPKQSITFVDNRTLSTSGSGDILVNIKGQSEKKIISNVSHVPDLNVNLLSVSALANKDFGI